MINETNNPTVPNTPANNGLNLCPARLRKMKIKKGISGTQMLMLKFILLIFQFKLIID